MPPPPPLAPPLLYQNFGQYSQGKNYTGALGDFVPEMQKKSAFENQKRVPENCHRLQCKSLFDVADLVNRM